MKGDSLNSPRGVIMWAAIKHIIHDWDDEKCVLVERANAASDVKRATTLPQLTLEEIHTRQNQFDQSPLEVTVVQLW